MRRCLLYEDKSQLNALNNVAIDLSGARISMEKLWEIPCQNPDQQQYSMSIKVCESNKSQHFRICASDSINSRRHLKCMHSEMCAHHH